ncbi:unnamed protein product [Rangifer tarandus platyrhynchus]|uniref:Uncharacterized protein n=1 Tax=Rangifer tarandus platyrhynchus TaxID=3082113 RepID=A0AC59ZKQ8_RANTA
MATEAQREVGLGDRQVRVDQAVDDGLHLHGIIRMNLGAHVSLVYINIITAFIVSLAGLLIYRSHLISSLLCLEGLMLSLFVIATLIILNSHFTLASMIPIILLVFAACEAALGLSLLVIVSNTYGIDYIQNLNLPQC